MDLTREAIDRIVELEKTEPIDLQGQKYTTKPVHRVNDPVASPLKGYSLTAVVDYLKENPDGIKRCLVEISSGCVDVTSPLNCDVRRSHYFSAKPNDVSITLNRMMDVESFKIMIMTAFIQDDNTKALLAFLSSLCEESSNELTDDGISQSIVAKTGVAQLDNVEVPNPIELRPYRTFCDIEQPKSLFVFRMQKGLRCALYEADGGAWIKDEVRAIKEFLRAGLLDAEGIDICLLG